MSFTVGTIRTKAYTGLYKQSKKLLGWEPKVIFEDGLEEVYNEKCD